MIRFLIISFLCSMTSFIWAQSELDRVRDMFPEPNEGIEVSIWKGQLQNAHPVEFFLGQKEKEVLGYYRLISSGEEFLLEGEISETGLSLTEYNTNGDELGFFMSSKIPIYDPGMELHFKWYDLDKTDVLDYKLQAARYSDFPPLAFRPQVKRYCNYMNNDNHCLLIELIDEKRVLFLDNRSEEANKEEILIHKLDPLSFSVRENGKEVLYERISDKLRRNRDNHFTYFTLENELEIKRISYASSEILRDVEYPYLKGNQEFNDFIGNIIEKHKQSSRADVKKNIAEIGNHPSKNHYKYKWQGWTIIDYLGNSLISGRMIFFNMSNGSIKKEVVVFNYDLGDKENIKIENTFKNDFNLDSYLEKFVRAELIKVKPTNTHSSELKIEDFKYLTFAENQILISTDYDWTYGETTFKIPHSELQSLIKRNSILKTLMRE